MLTKNLAMIVFSSMASICSIIDMAYIFAMGDGSDNLRIKIDAVFSGGRGLLSMLPEKLSKNLFSIYIAYFVEIGLYLIFEILRIQKITSIK